MQVFFVSIRTALIFGPGEILEIQGSEGEVMLLHATWPHGEVLGEWEGYAVVIPERNQVWGLAHPEVEEEQLRAQFAFAPQPIPPKDKRLFETILRKQAQAATADPENQDSPD